MLHIDRWSLELLKVGGRLRRATVIAEWAAVPERASHVLLLGLTVADEGPSALPTAVSSVGTQVA